jgi:predicted amidophosphoribosyltransferase
MMDAWLAFARTGNPAHAGIGEWPAYDTTRRATMVFDRETRLVEDPLGSERAVWDGTLATVAAAACPKCGAKTQGSKFCAECGSPLAAKARCAGCGAEADGMPKFCPECGKPYGA